MRAWVTVSQDPIFGFEQTSHTLYTKLYEHFTSFKTRRERDKSYDGRSTKVARSNFDSIAAYVQKFQIAKREVGAIESSGAKAEQNI